MRKAGKWALSVISSALVIILVILLLPFARQGFSRLFPDIRGEITTQSLVLKQHLQSSQRLEVTTAEEEGILEAKTTVIILGTVGKTQIKYRYTASIGIDLKRVELSPEEDRIVFCIPQWEILNDGIQALDVKKQNFLSHAIDKSTEALLEEQRVKCRQQFLPGGSQDERIWQDTIHALEETFCEWLASYGERHYRFEFRKEQTGLQENVRGSDHDDE